MKIISGGQTGVDRAGLDVAIAKGLDYGGAIPKGRLTEEGALSDKYNKMTELATSSYPARTEQNVKDSDATIIFTMGKIEEGSALTIGMCKKYQKLYLHIDLLEQTEDEAVETFKNWVEKIKPNTLNIAGSRESNNKGIYNRTYTVLDRAL